MGPKNQEKHFVAVWEWLYVAADQEGDAICSGLEGSERVTWNKAGLETAFRCDKAEVNDEVMLCLGQYQSKKYTCQHISEHGRLIKVFKAKHADEAVAARKAGHLSVTVEVKDIDICSRDATLTLTMMSGREADVKIEVDCNIGYLGCLAKQAFKVSYHADVWLHGLMGGDHRRRVLKQLRDHMAPSMQQKYDTLIQHIKSSRQAANRIVKASAVKKVAVMKKDAAMKKDSAKKKKDAKMRGVHRAMNKEFKEYGSIEKYLSK